MIIVLNILACITTELFLIAHIVLKQRRYSESLWLVFLWLQAFCVRKSINFRHILIRFVSNLYIIEHDFPPPSGSPCRIRHHFCSTCSLFSFDLLLLFNTLQSVVMDLDFLGVSAELSSLSLSLPLSLSLLGVFSIVAGGASLLEKYAEAPLWSCSVVSSLEPSGTPGASIVADGEIIIGGSNDFFAFAS
ncbi:hypothetical protein HJC23_001658, partial [Cyclotella cryptica]